jgi:hypothetical protein
VTRGRHLNEYRNDPTRRRAGGDVLICCARYRRYRSLCQCGRLDVSRETAFHVKQSVITLGPGFDPGGTVAGGDCQPLPSTTIGGTSSVASTSHRTVMTALSIQAYRYVDIDPSTSVAALFVRRFVRRRRVETRRTCGELTESCTHAAGVGKSALQSAR